MKPFRSLHFRRIAPFAAALPLAARAASPLLLPGGTTMLSSGSAEETRKSLVAVGKSLAEDTSTEVWIVQYDPEKTLASAIRNLVSGAGARILSPVSGGAYLVRATKAQQLSILESGEVVATRTYAPGDKCAPVEETGLAKGFAPGGEADGDPIFVVSAFGKSEGDAMRDKVAALSGCEVLDGGEGMLRVRMTDAGRAAAAALPEVAAIGPWLEPTLGNDIAVRAMHVDSIWPVKAKAAAVSATSFSSGASVPAPRPVVQDLFSKGLLNPDGTDPSAPAPAIETAPATLAAGIEPAASPVSALNLTGKGQIVAVCDSGLDTGDLSSLHPDVRDRVIKAFAYGRPAETREWTGDWSDPNGHGTHVVGSVLGNGTASDGQYTGPAYEAGLVLQSHSDARGLVGFDNLARAGLNRYAAILAHAYAVKDANGNSPRIHSNSWGAAAKGYYNEASQMFDLGSFVLPDLLSVIAAGNEGVDVKPPLGVIDPMSMGAPGTAKNSLTVGAAENSRTSGGYANKMWGSGSWMKNFPNDPIMSDLVSSPKSGVRGMAAFSSRGPCADGRIKPDIVAPGTDILSIRSRAVPNLPSTWGPFNEFYHFMGGTSMATPLVAGTAALVRQWCAERCGIANPDAATVKAVLCAGAKSLYPGQYGEGQFLEIPKEYPNNVEGWGMVDLENSVANRDGVAVKDGAIIAEGESATFRFRAPGGKPLCILMAYSDAPATAFSGGLVNDLDLTVTDPAGKRWYPNSKNGPDAVNNVEGVRWTAAPAGEYVATVRARSIQAPMDAGWTQNRENAVRFSLVANGALQAE